MEAAQQLQVTAARIDRSPPQSAPRRRWLAAAFGTALAMALRPARAAPPLVEIVAFDHPPVHSALRPLRDWLARQGSKLRVVEIDIESAEGERRLQAAGIKGHVPVVVLIDGRHRFPRADGSSVDLVGFPSGPGSAPGFKGTWSAADVESVLKPRLQ
jgi:hypothetical protein